MLAIIRITFCILEYDIGRSFLIKKHICFQQWWKTESSHKKNNGITKVQFIQKVEIVSWNPIYRWNPENSQNKMVLSVLLGMRDAFEPGVRSVGGSYRAAIAKKILNLLKKKTWPQFCFNPLHIQSKWEHSYAGYADWLWKF